MNYLVHTHFLVWLSMQSSRLTSCARSLLADPDAVDGRQAAFVSTLPLIQRDPFDRLLVAQANVEGITLITADEQIALYPGPILKI